MTERDSGSSTGLDFDGDSLRPWVLGLDSVSIQVKVRPVFSSTDKGVLRSAKKLVGQGFVYVVSDAGSESEDLPAVSRTFPSLPECKQYLNQLREKHGLPLCTVPIAGGRGGHRGHPDTASVESLRSPAPVGKGAGGALSEPSPGPTAHGFIIVDVRSYKDFGPNEPCPVCRARGGTSTSGPGPAGAAEAE
jgi:hypothetical protein